MYGLSLKKLWDLTKIVWEWNIPVPYSTHLPCFPVGHSSVINSWLVIGIMYFNQYITSNNLRLFTNMHESINCFVICCLSNYVSHHFCQLTISKFGHYLMENITLNSSILYYGHCGPCGLFRIKIICITRVMSATKITKQPLNMAI